MEIYQNRGHEVLQFSKIGEVYSFTTIYEAPAGFQFNTPYIVAIVRLQEGNFLTAQLTDVDPGEVYIGLPVEMVTRKLYSDGDRGVISYGYKFRPQF